MGAEVLIPLLIQVAVKYGPEAYQAFVDLVHKSDPTKADYDALTPILDAALANAIKAVDIAKLV